MIFPAERVRTHIGELLTVLDEDIQLLDLRRSQLEALSVAIVERDDTRLEALLKEVQDIVTLQADVDRRLDAVRGALAADLAMPAERVKLHVLADRLSGADRAQIEARRRRIVDLAERLRQQRLQTSVLLSECARVNRLLLEALFPRSRAVDTYGHDGPQRWWPDTGVVNAER